MYNNILSLILSIVNTMYYDILIPVLSIVSLSGSLSVRGTLPPSRGHHLSGHLRSPENLNVRNLGTKLKSELKSFMQGYLLISTACAEPNQLYGIKLFLDLHQDGSS